MTSPSARAPVIRVYTGSHEDCQEAMRREAAELAQAGYRVHSESYGVSWTSGVCIGCLTVEFRVPDEVATTEDAESSDQGHQRS